MEELIDQWLEEQGVKFDFRKIANVYSSRFRVDCYESVDRGVITEKTITHSFFLHVSEEKGVEDKTIYGKPKFENPFI